MSLSEPEFYEAGLALPPDVRKHVALQFLESLDPDEAFDLASESWLRTQAAAAHDALKADPSQAIPADNVRTRFEAEVGRPSMLGRIDYMPEAPHSDAGWREPFPGDRLV